MTASLLTYSMKKIGWIIIIIVIIAAAAVLFYGWRYGGWFSGASTKEGTFDLAKQEKIDQQTQDDIELRREVEDTRIALEAYGFDQGKLPVQLSELVPDYLAAVPAHVRYDRSGDSAALVSASLGELNNELMKDDDGRDDTRYELKVEIFKTE